MENLNLLDKIETKEKTRFGIIDFVSKKQIIFYDLTNNDLASLRVVILSWRLEEKEEYSRRFSLYAKMYFPTVNLPTPVIIPTNAIQNIKEIDISISEIKRKVKNINTANN